MTDNKVSLGYCALEAMAGNVHDQTNIHIQKEREKQSQHFLSSIVRSVKLSLVLKNGMKL
jgi:hypothetical protein